MRQVFVELILTIAKIGFRSLNTTQFYINTTIIAMVIQQPIDSFNKMGFEKLVEGIDLLKVLILMLK